MRLDLFQHIIDSLRGKLVYFPFYNVKKETYKNLLLGSSHIARIDFGEDSYNCAFVAGDLYYTNEFYKLFNKDSVENVIVSFSVFSPGYTIIRTINAHICAMLKILYNIPYQYEDAVKKKHLKFLEFLYGFNLKKFQDNYKLPVQLQNSPEIKINIGEIKKRTERHLKNNRREVKQLYLLEELLNSTQKNNQNVFIIIPPATHYYKEFLPSSKELFKDLYPITDRYNHCKVINLYDSDKFELSDFIDSDHLNYDGRNKLVSIVKSYMENTRNKEICDVK